MPNWRAPKSKPAGSGKLLGDIVTMSNEVAKRDMAEVVLDRAAARGRRIDQTKAYRIAGQESRLGQVFRNLIDNARSFTAPGTKVTCAPAPLWR